ncbi:LuxR C-terminal-related transcriptional regulator [Actinoplanes sp. NPDC049802]|uniref:LuxR C-terminal-related transcriptional regulator n=1 Tax=Actinoplanes sp. NPDC049802 TaxID=3154742 RepID=UPI0033DCF8A2
MPIAVDHNLPPRLPTGLVWRGRLVETLDVGVRRAVTLVCAGPGWGKTVLTATWATARSLSGPVAWLTLNERHNNPYTFWADLNRSLDAAGVPVAAAGTEAELRRAFGEAVTAAAGPVVVVLDDLHEVTDPRVLSSLAGLLGVMPQRLRFVLLSRRDPDLRLHRLRMSGDVTEIRAADLGFRVEEAGELLTLRGRALSPASLAALVRRTEGWGAGLRLTADAPDGADGADDAVADYLTREVLDNQPAEVRGFLLRTSLPDRICGDLADTLTGGAGGQQMLERLARDKLFVEPAGSGRWFRYHPMFRAVLRRHLAALWPDAPARLHRAAARWHAAEGSALSSLTHAAAAEDWDLLAALVVERGVPLYTSADRPQFVELLSRIPAVLLPTTPEMGICGVILSFARGELAAVPRRMAHARMLLAQRSTPDRANAGTALDVLEAGAVIRWHGDMPRLANAATTLLADLSRMTWDQAPSLPQYRAAALNNKGVAWLWSGRLDHADRYLWAAATASRTADTPYIEVNSFAMLACLAYLQGSLGEAGEHSRTALELARRIDAEHRATAAPAYLARALIETEHGREPEAEEALRQALHALGEIPEITMSVLAGLVRVRLTLDRGEAAGARTLLAQIRAEAGPPMAAPFLDRLIGLAGAEVRLALGDASGVLIRYAGQPDLTAAEQICLARARLATGNPAAAEELLARVREGADRISAVGAWLLSALAADTQGRSAVASEALARALAAAEPERIRRPFRHYDAHRVLVLAERQQWLTELRGPAGDGVLGEITGELPAIGAAHAAGPLSEREVDVLQYLPTVLTAGEIAVNLSISVNTVKAHMRSIYRKLGAGRRREAVVLARQAGLL